MALAKQDRLHREPIVILTGDLNASPCVTKKKDENDYYPYAYEALKSHSLGLRSVLNDDEVEPHQIGELAVAMLTCSSTSGLHNNLPPIDSTIRYNENTNFANEFSRDTNIGKSKSILMVGKSVSRVGSVVGSLVNDRIVSANIDAVADVLNDWDDIDLKAVDGGLESVTKEKSKKPTTVRNTSDLDKLTKKKIGKVSVSTTGQSVTQSESDTTHRDSSREMQVDQGIWTTWKVRRKKGVEEASRMCIDYILYTPPIIPSDNKGSSSTANDRALTITPSTASISTSTTTTTTAPTAKRYRPVGIRSKAILDLLSANVVGPALLPSSIYPSDHLAIAADLEIVIYDKDL